MCVFCKWNRDVFYYCLPLAFLKLSFSWMFNNLNMRLTEISPNMHSRDSSFSVEMGMQSPTHILWKPIMLHLWKIHLPPGISHRQHRNIHCIIRTSFAREPEKPMINNHFMGGSLERSVVRQEEFQNGFRLQGGKNMRRTVWESTEIVNLVRCTRA